MIGLASDPCRERQASTAPAAGSCPDRAKPWVVLTAILGSSMAFIDGTVVVVALAPMRESLGASLAQTQWVVNAYALTLAAFLLLGGAAGDAYGLRRMFMAGVGVFGLASLWCGLAGSPASLIAARALQGVGAALLVPGSLALISAHFTRAERGRAIGTWAASSGIAAAIGPILGGWLLDGGSWHLIFLINVPVAAATLLLAMRRVPEAVPPTLPRGMDWPGGGLAVLGLGALAFGATAWSEPGTSGERSWAVLALAAAAVVLAAFVRRESRADPAMLPLGLFRNRTFAAANLLTLLLYFALAGALFFVPTALMEAHGYSATRAGAVFLPFTCAMAVLSRLAGRWADRAGVRLPLATGSLLAAASFALLGPAVASGAFWSFVLPVMLLLGIGMGIVVAPLSTAVMNAVPDSQAGTASGVNNAVSRVAGLVAVATLGAVASFGYQAYLATGEHAGDGLAGVLARAGFGAPPGTAAGLDPAATADFQALRAGAIVAGVAAVTTVCAAVAATAALVGLLALERGATPATAGRGGAA